MGKNRSQAAAAAAAGPFPSNTFAQMLDFVTYLLGRSTNMIHGFRKFK